ncbi:MAG TPA: hypothetical protein VII25_11915 [Candidatus Acidoferrum sp.]
METKLKIGNKSKESGANKTGRDIVAPLFRHWKITAWVFGIVFGLSTLVAWVWAANYYVVTMQVLVEQDRSDPAITAAQNAAVVSNKGVTTDQVTSEVALLKGKDMLQTVAASCGLTDGGWSPFNAFLPSDPAKRRAVKVEKVALGLVKKITVDATTASNVIDVKYGKWGEPETPACVLQTLSNLYLQKHLALQRPAGSTDFFAAEADKYQKALEVSEKRLSEFSSKAGVAAPEVLRNYMAQQEANSEASLYQAHQSIAADQERLKSIKAQMETTPSRATTSEVSNSASLLLQQLETNLVTAQMKRTQLLVKYEPTYPLVLEADQEIAETKAAIEKATSEKYVNKTTDRDQTYELLRADLAKTQTDLASQLATAAALQTSITSMKKQIVHLDGQAIEQGALVRDAKANEGNYLLYQNKREQEKTSDALDKKGIANVAIAVPPMVPLLPAHSPVMVMILGLAFALFSAIAAAFVAEYMDPSFRTPAEVTETLHIPVLAFVPKRAA